MQETQGALLAQPAQLNAEGVVKDLARSEKLEVFGYFGGFALVRTGGTTGWVSDRLTD
jgi:hypothetical protein